MTKAEATEALAAMKAAKLASASDDVNAQFKPFEDLIAGLDESPVSPDVAQLQADLAQAKKDASDAQAAVADLQTKLSTEDAALLADDQKVTALQKTIDDAKASAAAFLAAISGAQS